MDRNELWSLYQSVENVNDRIKIEAFLFQNIGMRSLSIITIPQEMKNNTDLGKRIDASYDEAVKAYESQFAFKKLDFTKRRMAKKAVKHKELLLKEAFDKVVYEDDIYKEFVHFGHSLGLNGIEYQVRPSIREIILYNNEETAKETKKLMQLRMLIRKDSKKKFNEETPLHFMLYPEELSPKYIAEIGKLLGYPQCCIQAYLSDLSKGDSPHVRAAVDFYSAKRKGTIEPWAYYLKDFLPCTPKCRAAQELGRQAHDKLKEIHPDLGRKYKKLIEANMALMDQMALKLRTEIKSTAQSQDEKRSE